MKAFKGLASFFTNAGKEKQSDVKAPAYSLTKVSGLIGLLVAGIGGTATKLEGATAVKVAAIGGAALVVVAYFGVAAVDLITRQRAAEAKLRWPKDGGGAGKGPTAKKGLVADLDDLILLRGPDGDQYELRFAELEEEKVTLVAMREGKAMDPAPTFSHS